MLQIDIVGLNQGLHDLVMEPSAQELRLDPEEFSNIRMDIKLDYDPRRILVQFSISGTAQLICDRTLEIFHRPVNGSYTVLFSSSDELTEGGDGYDDVRVLDKNATTIDIAEAARDTLLLSLPLRRVAPEAEDEDLPLSFGKDEDETDPRWDALRSLK